MLNDRQKKVLKTYEKKGWGKIEIGDIEGFDEARDLSNKDFTLALAKLNPFYTTGFNFKCFTKTYSEKIVDAGKIFFANRIEDCYYRIEGALTPIDEELYDDDWKVFSDMVKEKTALRAAWVADRKKVDTKYAKKDKELNR